MARDYDKMRQMARAAREGEEALAPLVGSRAKIVAESVAVRASRSLK